MELNEAQKKVMDEAMIKARVISSMGARDSLFAAGAALLAHEKAGAWQEIKKGSIPNVGDELWNPRTLQVMRNPEGYVGRGASPYDYTFAGWTHFRAINPPTPATSQPPSAPAQEQPVDVELYKAIEHWMDSRNNAHCDNLTVASYIEEILELRSKKVELEKRLDRLERMRAHCENCGSDYVATGIEAGCPCRLIAAIRKANDLIHRNHVAKALEWLEAALPAKDVPAQPEPPRSAGTEEKP